jgi:hypothetical protein
MSSVYGSSFLTIYASSSPNSDTGFLQPRPQNRYLKTKLCTVPGFPDHWVWFRFPQGNLVWDMSEYNGRLWSRAWAFQELVLPPRILEYGPRNMHFRCNAGHREETSRIDYGNVHDGYKELLWILALPNITNASTLEHPNWANSSLTMTVYERWYDLVQGYTSRDLTFETDKLPAISGLAEKIRQVTGDEYLAGLWKNDLATSLCWGRRYFVYHTRPSAYLAPSWSWASTQGAVTYRQPEGRKLKVELVGYDLETDEFNPFGSVSRGSITISAPIRRLDTSKDTVHGSEEWDGVAEKVRVTLTRDGSKEKLWESHLFPLEDQRDVLDPRGTGLCAVCFDVEPDEDVREVFLVRLLAEGCQMKLERPNSDLKPEGIVLSSVEGNEELYRRIGIWGMWDAMAEWMDEGEYSAFLGWERKEITII